MSKVKVTADAAGIVVVPSKNNPDWGYIRVKQIREVVDEQGFGHNKPVSSLIQGTLETLRSWNWKEGQELSGVIIFKEGLTPFSKKDPERDHKVAGETKIICCDNGAPIYRKSFYSQDPSAVDVLHPHTNGDDIKIAYQEILAARKAQDVKL